jgi:hypothetical protein
MQLCDICKEPSARRVTSGRDGQTVTKSYYHVHAAEAGVLELPPDRLQRAAVETDYPVNAMIFVVESLIRDGFITEAETADEVARTVEVTKTPLEICVSLSQAAVERFQQQAGLALSYWKLRRGSDIGAVLSWLVRSGTWAIAGGGFETLPEALSAMEGPLIVEAQER